MDRKEQIRHYKETPRPAGVYRVVRRSSGRTLFGSSPDVPSMLNRIRAQLDLGSHPNRQLQADWDHDGADDFDFEILDLLPEPEQPGEDISSDLETLHRLWEDHLQLDPDLRY